jgi:hypothetical protein
MLDACAQLTQRLAPFRAALGDKATWQDVVAAAAAKGTCLSVEVRRLPAAGKRRYETPGPILDDSRLMYEAIWPCLVLAWQGWYAPLASGSDMFKYFVHCAAATTIELHLLTGQLQVPM